jgi:hypothetical protein
MAHLTRLVAGSALAGAVAPATFTLTRVLASYAGRGLRHSGEPVMPSIGFLNLQPSGLQTRLEINKLRICRLFGTNARRGWAHYNTDQACNDGVKTLPVGSPFCSDFGMLLYLLQYLLQCVLGEGAMTRPAWRSNAALQN